MKILAYLNDENISPEELEEIPRRSAVRTICVNEEGNLVLAQSRKHGYYELPGGGVEKDEDLKDALKRECLEEVGVGIEDLKVLGKTISVMISNNVVNQTTFFISKVSKILTPTENDYDTVFLSPENILEILEKEAEKYSNNDGEVHGVHAVRSSIEALREYLKVCM